MKTNSSLTQYVPSSILKSQNQLGFFMATTNSGIDKINGNFKGRDILSLDQFSSKDIDILLKVTREMKKLADSAKPSNLITGNVITLIFYEPSSRTFGSFSSAIKRIGGQTVEIQNPQQFSSVAKGETLEDTIRTFECYSNAIVMRNPLTGAAAKAAGAAHYVPIINAGDGIGEHPTQALLDLATINEKHGRLDNLTGLMAGDLLNGRTVHSLIRGLSLYKNNTIYLLSPKQLKLSQDDFETLSKRGIKLIEIEHVSDIPKTCDFWYWTRVQKERFASIEEYEKLKYSFIVTPELMKTYAKKDMILMHPLPRVGEIETAVDDDPRAVYLRTEMKNGMYVRMALVALIFGKA